MGKKDVNGVVEEKEKILDDVKTIMKKIPVSEEQILEGNFEDLFTNDNDTESVGGE